MTTIDFDNKFYSLKNILHGFAYKLTKDYEEAQDLFQETAFRVIKNRDKFAVGTNLKAWSFTIMKNIFINNYRKQQKVNTVIDRTDNNFYLNSGTQTIRNEGDANIMMEELTEMISGLEDGIRIPFLRHYEGYKYQEIADEMQLPLGTVKSRIYFARKEMKFLLKRKYGMTANERL